jgi:hypothetical protein
MSEWTISDWASAMSIAQFVSTVILCIIVFYLRGSFVTKSAHAISIEKSHQRIDLVEKSAIKTARALADRVAIIEGRMDTLATKEDIASVKLALERQDGDRRALAVKVDGVLASVQRMEKPLDLIQDYLLNQGRRS